jgi:hypothetical protein
MAVFSERSWAALTGLGISLLIGIMVSFLISMIIITFASGNKTKIAKKNSTSSDDASFISGDAANVAIGVGLMIFALWIGTIVATVKYGYGYPYDQGLKNCKKEIGSGELPTLTTDGF